MSELLWKSTPVLLYPQALYGTTKQSESLPFSCSRSFAVQISHFSTTKASNHQISSTTLSRCCQTLFQHHFMSENCLRLPNICVLCFGDFFPPVFIFYFYWLITVMALWTTLPRRPASKNHLQAGVLQEPFNAVTSWGPMNDLFLKLTTLYCHQRILHNADIDTLNFRLFSLPHAIAFTS